MHRPEAEENERQFDRCDDQLNEKFFHKFVHTFKKERGQKDVRDSFECEGRDAHFDLRSKPTLNIS
jgi:hypothetical protein